MTHTIIYKISPRAEWEAAQQAGTFTGATIDVADGFIHFSTAEQAQETLDKHFAGQSDLVLAAIATGPLGVALKWEPSRGGALFPHLYGSLDMAHLLWTRPIITATDGTHTMPDLI
ncbi:MAG: DUF952 domain-containing protein [Pseudomonadota bacterium]